MLKLLNMRRIGREGRSAVVAFMAVGAVFMGIGVAQASAAEVVTVTPSTVQVSELVEPYPSVHVEGTGFEAYNGNPNMVVGLCTVEKFSFEVPACALFTDITVANGEFQTDVTIEPVEELTAEFPNAHVVIPGQPPTFDCASEACAITVAEHGTEPKFLASTALSFE